MNHVFHRHTKAQLPTAVRGDGVYIVDGEGRRYLDASGGAAVSCLGHSDPDVIRAVQEQVSSLAFAHSGFFTTAPAEELADRLIAEAPEGLDRVYFVSGGSEAMEAALKLARQFFLESGQPQRTRFVARRQSYHGNTLGALAVGGNVWRRTPFESLLMDVRHIAPCYAYRDRREDEREDAYGRRVADELETAILEIGAEGVCAFVAEPVVGATLGAVAAVPGYFRRIREICDKYGVLLILDEVMCGMGRTGTLYACEREGISPDILITAKGLGAGYQPIGAMLVSGKIYSAIRDESGFFQHGHTYMGHPTACAAALAVQKAVAERNLLENVRRRGAQLEEMLTARLGNHRHVGDIRGRGLFRGVELVADRASKAPFDASLGLAARVKAEAMKRELICYPMSGTIDGRSGDHVLLAPPFIVDESNIADITDRLADAIDAAIGAAAP